MYGREAAREQSALGEGHRIERMELPNIVREKESQNIITASGATESLLQQRCTVQEIIGDTKVIVYYFI